MARTAWPTFASGDSFSAAQSATYERDNDLAYWVFTEAGQIAYSTGSNALAAVSKPSVDSLLKNTSAGVPSYLALTALYALIMPVGFVITLGVSTNPATLYGFGTWTAIAGKVIVGINAADAEFDTLNETGGAKTHTLITAEMPAHTHSISPISASIDAGGNVGTRYYISGSINTGSTGGDGAHNNLQPYIVKYCWERVS